MPHFYKKDGSPVWVPNEQAAQAWKSGQYGLPQGRPITIINQRGETGGVSPDELGKFLDLGWSIESREQENQRYYKERYGDSEGAAFAAGVGRGLTFGLSDMALTGLGAVEPETLEGLRQANPTSTLAGEAGGIVLGTVGTGGAGALANMAKSGSLASRALQTTAQAARYIPAHAVSNLGLTTAKVVEKKLLGAMIKGQSGGLLAHMAAKGGGAAIAGSIEGALYGAGAAVTEEALGNLDGVSEALSSYILPYALVGGAAGGALGVGGVMTKPLADKAFKKVKDGADWAAKKLDIQGAAENMLESRVYGALKIKNLQGINPKKRDAFRSVMFDDDVLPDGALIKEGIKEEEIIERLGDAAKLHGARIGEHQIAMDQVMKGFNLPSELAPNPQRMIKALDDEIIPKLEEVALSPEIKKVLGDAQTLRMELEQTPFWGFEQAQKLKGLYNEQAKWASGKISEGIKYNRDIAKMFAQELDDAYLRVYEAANLNKTTLDAYKRSNHIYYAIRDIKNKSDKGRKKLGNVANSGIGGMAAKFLGAFGRQAIWSPHLGLAGMGYRAAAYTALGVAGKKIAGGSMFGGRASLHELDKISKLGILGRKVEKVETRIDNIIKGAVSMGKGSRRFVTPASLGIFRELTKEKDRKKAADKFFSDIERFASNPENIADRVTATTHLIEDVAPQTASKMTQVVINTLNTILERAPKLADAPSLQPMLQDRVITPDELMKAERTVFAALFPVAALEEGIKGGNLTKDTVEVIKTLYPSIFSSVSLGIIEAANNMKTKLTHAQKSNLFVLFGIPLDQSQTPKYLQRAQQVFTPTQRQGKGPGGISLKGLEKVDEVGDLHKTKTQRLGEKL